MPEHEKRLVEKVKSGDMDAYERLMDIYANKLRVFIAYRVPARHLVNEIAQEVFVFAFERINEFRGNTNFGSWLRAIAYNKIRHKLLNFAREQRHKREYFSELLVRSTRINVPSSDPCMIEHLKDCVQQLPEHLNELVNLKYNLSFSGIEIAEKLDRSASWVRTSLFRVRKMLRKCVERKTMQEA